MSDYSTPPPEPKTPREHSPRIALDWPRIVGCSCGWITPPGTADSDTTWVEHAALHAAVRR